MVSCKYCWNEFQTFNFERYQKSSELPTLTHPSATLREPENVY